jgi:hypothetical protein
MSDTPTCKRGHAQTAENVSMQKDGDGTPRATCRQCNRERAKARRAALTPEQQRAEAARKRESKRRCAA